MISPIVMPQLMTTMMIFVQDRELNLIKCRIATYALPIGAINFMNTMTKTISMFSMISDLGPSKNFSRNFIKIPSNIELADPKNFICFGMDLLIGAGVDLLIGAEATLSLFLSCQINLTEGMDSIVERFNHCASLGKNFISSLKNLCVTLRCANLRDNRHSNMAIH
ncbi:hypothetical protein ALC56_01684 [Trachymyrmex septentrionalis]|uniref:Uncharacterized protein n=1 Tax=Trachymyrmex septentrionalis TaxID=34720 RepID=A0A195FT82_9HYME|nr:hypothetical protein ALC56_01684 [Trachymyrmex septentrionalis]